MPMDGTVLVADDDRTIRTVLTQALTRAGCRVHATSSLTTLMRWVEEGKGDLVISDVIMPDGNGIEMLPRIRALRPGLPVIVISAQNTIMTAIQATEAEAWDYLPKPFDLPDLLKRASRALEATSRRGRAAAAPPPPREVFDAPADADLPLVGRTPAMQTLYRLVARVMNTDMAVLITGESGTGKSLIARALHDFSDRRSQPFVLASGRSLGRGMVRRARSGGASAGRHVGHRRAGRSGRRGAGAAGAAARHAARGTRRACWRSPRATFQPRSRPARSAPISTTGSPA
jgi:two-component system, NtrC family, nitrogen regulation response regulator GlnG